MSKEWTSELRRVPYLLFWLMTLGVVARAQTFSGDLVTTHAGSEQNRRVGHVYVSGARVRIESPDFADGFFIVDGDAGAAWFVRPRQRVFMDAKQSSPLTRQFVIVDPNDPCHQWQVMAQIAGAPDADGEWRCDPLGRELVDGRETLKYAVWSPHGRSSYRWIDPQRAFPVRIETEDGTRMVLEHIGDAPPASSLFAIPPDYHKFNPSQLIELIKRSDVWVEPPPK
jgi:hypothetical protein